MSKLHSWILGEENLGPKDVVIQPTVHEQEDGYAFFRSDGAIFKTIIVNYDFGK